MSDPLSLSTLDMFNLPEDVFNRESGLLTQREQEEVAYCPIVLFYHFKISQIKDLVIGEQIDNTNYK